jgi:molybdate transport system permease protein
VKIPKISPLKLFASACLGLLVFFLLIVVFSAYLFTNPWAIFAALLSDEIWFSIVLTLFTATISTLLALAVSVPAAYALANAKFRGKNIVDALLNIPIVLPPVALGTALLIFFTNTPLGVFINTSIIHFVFEVPGIILAQFIVISALLVRLMKPVFENIDPRYTKIARTLGHTETQSFFHVTLPLAKNGIYGGTALAWARAMGEFGATVTLAGATRMKTETLSVAMYLNLSIADLEKAMAVILILIILTVPILLIVRKLLFKEPIHD